MQIESDVSGLLQRARGGDHGAVDLIVPLVYEELRLLAHYRLGAERSEHTLNTTGLVHEVYLRLVGSENVEWRDRAHFLALASRVMRRVLVDYARRQRTTKRGKDWVKIELRDELQLSEPDARAIRELDEALTSLEKVSPRRSRLLEQRYFGGLKLEECAEALGVSMRTVQRELNSARAWLARELLA
jgi:RNA polymerase sigma factor (TIGR02999 family)